MSTSVHAREIPFLRMNEKERDFRRQRHREAEECLARFSSSRTDKFASVMSRYESSLDYRPQLADFSQLRHDSRLSERGGELESRDHEWDMIPERYDRKVAKRCLQEVVPQPEVYKLAEGTLLESLVLEITQHSSALASGFGAPDCPPQCQQGKHALSTPSHGG
eukprot:1202941-Pyramimonas_sp.AAC.1